MGLVRRRDGRRLSPVRLLVVLTAAAAVAALTVTGVTGVRQWVAQAAAGPNRPWFAGYVDVTAQPTYEFGAATGAAKAQVLSFIVADKADPCSPSWGAAYSPAAAADALDLDRRIARLRARSGTIAVSFGGQANTELANACSDPTALLAAYRTIVERYDVSTIDLDLEGTGLSDRTADRRRVAAVRALQRERRAAGHPLAVWLTLPVTPAGLSEDGTDTVTDFLRGGVDVAGVNVMTMDYGESKPKGQSMAQAAEDALTATHRQLGILYDRADLHQDDVTLWRKIGATPMIGQNDDADEVFKPADATALNVYARSVGVGRMSMWSQNRDRTCGDNFVDVRVVSDGCSGVQQHGIAFADTLGRGFAHDLDTAAGVVTSAQPTSPVATDDPATSPYPIWTEAGSYLAGPKVVWHRTVYEAKWWTRGDLPDDPVLNSWETPWQLVGPVLPGETPIPAPSLPAGMFSTWSGTAHYEEGDRVVFAGTPFEAKWWNTGDSPAAAGSDPDGSP